MELLTNTLIPFGSTFAGVFLAFLLGVWWQRHQRIEEEKKLRVDTKAALSEELEGVHSQVTRALERWQDGTIPLLDFPTDVKDSSVASGRFTLLDPVLQTEVSHIYAVIGHAIDYRSRWYDPRFSDAAHELFKGRLRHLEQRIPPLLQDLRVTTN